MQQGKPVYFTIKTLTETQKGYVTIELESLAVAWAVEKFHHFLYDTHFILEMDQKPIEAILSKSLNQATPQLQRILFLRISIKYINSDTQRSLRPKRV